MMPIYDLNLIYYGEPHGNNALQISNWMMHHFEDFEQIGYWHIGDKKAGESLGIEWNHIMLYRSKDKQKIEYKIPIYNHKFIKDWIFVNEYPPAVVLDHFHSERFLRHRSAVFVLYVYGSSSMKSMDSIIEFKEACKELQKERYLCLYLDTKHKGQMSKTFTMKMELNASTEVPCVNFYNPSHYTPHHETLKKFQMDRSWPITKENILKFKDDLRAEKTPGVHKNEVNIVLDSTKIVQNMARSSFKTKTFRLMKSKYDLIILFYHSQDYHQYKSKRALKQFDHAGEILEKRQKHLNEGKNESELYDIPVRLLKFNLSKNTKFGLFVKSHQAPIIRMYRVKEGIFYVDH